MSVTPVLSNPPLLPLPPEEQPKPRKPKYTYSDHKASDAALRFLLDHDPKGFDQLIGLSYIACRGLYFPDAWTPYAQDGSKMLGQEEVVRDFIVGWLTKELEPYKSQFADDIQLSEPKLRYIPRRCRLAIVAKIRQCPACGQRKTKECLDCEYIFSHRDINRGTQTCPKCGSDDLHVVCRRKCQTPSVRTSFDAGFSHEDSESKSKLGDYLIAGDDPEILGIWLVRSRPLLEEIHPKLFVYLRLTFAHFQKQGYKRLITNRLAAAETVSLKVARKLRKEIESTFRDNLHKPIIQELYRVLERTGDNYKQRLAIPISRRTKQAMQAKREASQLIREGRKELGLKGPDIAPAPERESTYADYDPPSPGVDSKCYSSRLLLETDGGLREIAAREILEESLKDVGDEDDIRAYFGLEEDESLPVEPDNEFMKETEYDENNGYDVANDD
jgi:hypothetical protein